MRGRDIEIAATDGSGTFAGYLVEADAEDAPAVVVLQEVFGVNAEMRAVTDRLGELGYTALCPDLFWRDAPGVQLDPANAADSERAFALLKRFDIDLGVRDIVAALEFLRQTPARNRHRRLGAVGYCLGGRLAYLTACRTHADASIGYYGVGIEHHLEEAPAISGHLMLHLAQEDRFVDRAAQHRIHEVLDPHPKVTLHDYPGVDHAFARPGGARFDAAAARLADERSFAFLERHLRSA